MSIKGLDVSKFQGEVDWERVKAAGYRFAMLRAGYGFNTVDPQFRRNASECNRIGLPIGAYWFCYAVSPSSAVQEADGCLDTIADYKLEYPVCYDIEQASVDYASGEGVTITPELAKQLVKSFCDRIEAKGYFAMFYSNKNFLDQYLGSDIAKRYALWYARYADTFDGTDCAMWQYTSQGSVPGISGNVDLNLSYVDFPSVIRSAGLNRLSGGTPSPSPSPSPSPAPSTDYITYVIQSGDTLSGIAARYGTTVSELTRLNGISDPDRIYAGNTLKVPESGASYQTYTIRSGDTLNGIAARYGTTVSELAKLNDISDPDRIYAGNTIRIPSSR
ncbi:MAG TPA: LysM peptidoglycan-binding domain-containing protein [Candidatus Mediterraneibacter intestinavium]|nr:LysM peptidoglycan-binding domain-containing protein [Candidatus Mediterraneibacter intestinavium]